MQTDIVIVKLDQARLLLSEAKTIQDTKKVLDIAASAEIFARRQKLGDEAVHYATEIKLEALRQLGEMLKATERNKGANGVIVTGSKRVPVMDDRPTLSDLGLDKKISKLAQDVAALPAAQFELVRAGAIRLSEAQKEVISIERKTTRENLSHNGKSKTKHSQNYQLLFSDIREGLKEIPDSSVDAIITDPPYPKEFLYVYSDLSKLAARVLRPGGLCVVMYGHSYLPDVYQVLGEHLTYHWTAAYLTPGGQSPYIFDRKVNTFWKPLLLFSKGKYTGKSFGDVCKSAVNDNDKLRHDWGQSESGMSDVVERFSEEGDWILDPFTGSSTTGYCALKLGRRYIGVDNDETQINISAERLSCFQK